MAATGPRAQRRVGTARVWHDGQRVAGLRTADGERIEAATTVLAAGAWSGQVEGLASGLVPPVRPVKGQTLRLRLPQPPTHRVVRGSVRGSAVYVVPRSDGELVVGASSEEAGFDTLPRAGAVYELLRDAQSLLPELGEAVLAEVCTGLRPASPDNAPMVGPAGVEGLVIATGHYRNGILLAPITADAVADLITTGALPALMAPFCTDRFTRAAA